MTLHLGLPHAHHRNAEQQHEIREARRMLKERIRNDWEYPPLPAFQKPVRKTRAGGNDEARIAGFKFHAPNEQPHSEGLSDELDFEPVEWRERDYSSEEDEETAEAEVKTSGWGNGEVRKTSSSSGDHHHRHKKLSSIFKFEGPDSVGRQVEERKVAKRQKRQKALDEEVGWNDGLAHWLARRDAWCCARTSAQVQMLERRQQHSTDATSVAALSDASASPRTSTSTASSSVTPSAAASSPSTTPDIAPSHSPTPTTVSTQPAAPPSDLLVPLAPTLLPNHPIRKRITPDLYPEIYSKIIISGRTPSVPINLLVLTRALVQGWKDDGEWPPKQTPVEKSIGRKKGSTGESSIKSGVKAVGRVLRITGTGTGTGTGASADTGGRERERQREKG